MLRILCVFADLNIGGAESMCMNIYRKIDKSKIQFDFVKHSDKKGYFEDEIHKLGGKVFTAPRLKFYNIFQYMHWWKKHLKNHPEHLIIHGHYFTISALFFYVAQKLKRITVAHSHSTAFTNNHRFSPSIIIKNRFLSSVEKYSDFCIACSKEAGNFVFPNKKFFILKNAIDTRKFLFNSKPRDQIRKELHYSNSDIVICIVASFTNPKNPFGVIEIFNSIHQNNPNTKLLWVGDGPLRTQFEEKIIEHNLNNSIKLLGIRNDAYNILQAADIFMLASFFEGLPVSVIEAQASGLPCILSDGISMDVSITDLCQFLPIDNPLVWSQAVSKLNYTQRKNTKADIVAAGYDVETTAKWLENFYTEILKERNLNNE